MSGPPRAASWPQMVRAQSAMELRLTGRRFENLFVMLVIPPALLAFFGAVPVLSTGFAKPMDFLLPGILALAVISTAFVNLGIATGFERGYGVLKRLGGSPLPRSALLVAKLVSVALIEVLQVALLIAIAVVAFGWRPAPDASVGVLAAGLVGGTLAFAGLGLSLAGTLRPEGTLALANGLFLLFLLLGGVVLPLGHLPGPLEALAHALPAAALSDVIRVGLQGGSTDIVGPFIVLAGWGVGSVVLAVRTFRWD
jgi:ABC-2 type transport system permease protein